MDGTAKPTPPEDLVGKDELDEDDEMELSADDLVESSPANERPPNQ
jgi:hypothetical protein